MKITLRKRGNLGWVVDYKPPGGKRKRQLFETRALAAAEAKSLQKQKAEAGNWWVGLDARERNELMTLYADVLREGFTLRQAVDFYMQHKGVSKGITLRASFDQFMVEKEAARLSPKTLAALRSNVGRFIHGRDELLVSRVTRDEVLS